MKGIKIKIRDEVHFVGQYCKFCKYEWIPRKEKPRQCPNCKRQIQYDKNLKGFQKGETKL